MTAPSLFDGPHDPDDETKDPRLSRQLVRVYEYLRDAYPESRTLDDISTACGGTTASVSARLRDLKKPRFGGFLVRKMHVSHGLYKYRVVPESGDERLVYDPRPDDTSKREAANRLRTTVTQLRNAGFTTLRTPTGAEISLDDLDRVLR